MYLELYKIIHKESFIEIFIYYIDIILIKEDF